MADDKSYIGVIRGADEAESRDLATYVTDLRAAIAVLEHIVDMRNATIERMGRVGADVIEQLTDEVEVLRTNVTRLRSAVALRDDEIEDLTDQRDTLTANLNVAEVRCQRLWRQLEEATDTPLVMHEWGCSLDAGHKGSCVRGEAVDLLRQADDLIGVLRDNVDHAYAEVERLKGGREIEQTMLANVLPTLAANDAENEALRAEVASLRAFQSQPRAVLIGRCLACDDDHCNAVNDADDRRAL